MVLMLLMMMMAMMMMMMVMIIGVELFCIVLLKKRKKKEMKIITQNKDIPEMPKAFGKHLVVPGASTDLLFKFTVKALRIPIQAGYSL